MELTCFLEVAYTYWHSIFFGLINFWSTFHLPREKNNFQTEKGSAQHFLVQQEILCRKTKLSSFTVVQDCTVSIIKARADIRHDQQGAKDKHFYIFPSRLFAFCKNKNKLTLDAMEITCFFLNTYVSLFQASHFWNSIIKNVHLVERQISE